MVSATSLEPIKIEDKETILIIFNLRSPSYMDHMHEIQTYLIIEEIEFQKWYFDIYNYLKNQIIIEKI